LVIDVHPFHDPLQHVDGALFSLDGRHSFLPDIQCKLRTRRSFLFFPAAELPAVAQSLRFR